MVRHDALRKKKFAGAAAWYRCETDEDTHGERGLGTFRSRGVRGPRERGQADGL